MDKEILREVASEYLVPFFSGARLQTEVDKSSTHDSLVAFRGPCAIAFKVSKEDDYRLTVTRSQPFAKEGDEVVPEIAVVKAFVDVVGPMSAALNSELKHDLLATFQRRVVARAISSAQERESVLLAGIDQLIRWSATLYEGAAISAAIGFRHKPQSSISPNLEQLAQNDFSSVLSNGHDTLLEFDFEGRFISHASLSPGDELPTYCPLGQVAIAEWTAADLKRRRVALCLNRVNEILVLRDRQLLFARRSGRWSFLTHESTITQMSTPHDMAIRRAIYETCLDASFARRGACIGVVSSSYLSKWPSVVVSSDDHIAPKLSVKAKAVGRMIRGRKFHHLDRRLRQELVAIDGATVLSHTGDLLAVGAILKIPGGSTGGGRLAAAKALGKLGLGIKVSQDGGIIGFRPSRTEAAFKIM